VFLTAQYEKQLWLVIALLLAFAGTAAHEEQEGEQGTPRLAVAPPVRALR
jgi:hypothetical protein